MRLDSIENIKWLKHVKNDSYGNSFWIARYTLKKSKGCDASYKAYGILSKNVEKWSSCESYNEECFWKPGMALSPDIFTWKDMVFEEYMLDRSHGLDGQPGEVTRFKISKQNKQWKL